MGTIADTYNAGDFINLDMQELVRDYVLSLKDGHGRAYSAILSLETEQIDQEGRITTLEGNVGGEASSAPLVGYKITMTGHGFSNFEPVFFNGSSFVRASRSAGACDGVVLKLDDNNFMLLMKGVVLLDPTLTDEDLNSVVEGQWYFLSDTLGKVSINKPISGRFQSIFKVILDHNSVKYAEVDCGQSFNLTSPVKPSITECVSYSTAGTYDWTVPSEVYKIKVTCAGAGGGGGAQMNSTDGENTTVAKNGLNQCTGFGGKKGIGDWQLLNSPDHGTATGGDVNIKGGGSVGGIGVYREHRGDNDDIGSNGTNGGLAIKYIDVVPADTIRCVIGAGGSGGMNNGDSENGIPDLYSRAGVDGYVIIEY